MSEPRCPDCGGDTQAFPYSDVARREVVVGVKCQSCKRLWATTAEFSAYCEEGAATVGTPHKICKVCGKDAKHRMDSVWRSIDPTGGPSVCQCCFMCPTCGTNMFLATEHGEVECEVCHAHWGFSKEFEDELLSQTWVLGLEMQE